MECRGRGEGRAARRESGLERAARRMTRDSSGVGRQERWSGAARAGQRERRERGGAARVPGERHSGMRGERRGGRRGEPARVGSSCRECRWWMK